MPAYYNGVEREDFAVQSWLFIGSLFFVFFLMAFGSGFMIFAHRVHSVTGIYILSALCVVGILGSLRFLSVAAKKIFILHGHTPHWWDFQP